jgi:glucose/arabinose dehydrogenase
MRMLSLVLTGCLLFICGMVSAQTLPSGFSTSTIGSSWNLPLGTAFTTDGQKLFVWEKDGRVYVCNRDGAGNYIKQTTPVLDISEEVANWGDHGLMGFALDPNYLSNGLIYLLYVVDRHYLLNFGTPSYNPNTSSTGATIGRITRYKTVTSGSNLATDISSRKILLGETKTTGICIMHDSHGLGTLAFAADGTLLASAGDGASYYVVDKGSDTDTDFQQALQDGIIRPEENVGAFRAQMLNCHNGKLLRIDPNTGDGVSSNPYYSTAQPRSPKSRVWAFGLRNPFRISFKPGTGSTNPAAGDIGEIYVGDVGWNSYEEVTVISTPGVNCGWPLFEGLTPQPGYTNAVTANKDEPNPLFGINGCTKQFFNFQDLIKQATADNNKTVFNSCNTSTPIGTGNRYYHHRPMIDWKHFTDSARVGIFSGNNAAFAQIGTGQSNVVGTPFAGNCAVGGPFYTGTNFPAAYSNRYFAADHDQKWIRCFSMDFTDVVTEVKPFGTGFNGLVNINMNPLDGTLVIVELGNFTTIQASIKQVKYGGNQAPIVRMTSDKTFGPSVLTVNFTGNTSSDPDGTIASYAWNFGDGGTSTSANPSHNFTAPANTPTKFVVKLTVTDNQGASSLDSIIISVNNTPPQVNITSPIKNSLYRIGPDTLYTCAATVTDSQHSGAGLKYEWQTILRHNNHQHPEPISNAVSPTTLISRMGCNGDDYYWLIQLTVTDAAGLSAKDSSKIFPDCSPGVDNTPPVVSSVSPVDGATSITTATSVSAMFNETIDPATVTNTTFQLKDAANNIINATINTSFNQLTLVPSASLAGLTVYTATIKGGASGVKDLAGNALANDYSWSFTTVDVDLTPPAVISVLPVNGATDVSTGAATIANFSEAINGSTINGTTFQLRDAGNNLVPATITTASGQATLTPSIVLSGSAVYTATITGGASGVKDLAGNALLNDFVWSFTTAAVDNIPPTVTSVLPANVAIGVSTTTTIIANLSEAINPSTVTSTTFQLKDASNNLVAATVSSSSGVLTLTPTSALATSTTYTATLSGGASGIKDLTGNALADNYSWSFTTVAGTTAPPVTIQSVTSKTAIGATSNALTGVPAGALLVLATTADAFPSDCIVSSTPTLTWTKRVDAGASQSDNAEIWTAVYAAGGAITITTDWGDEFSQANLVYVVLNAEPNLAGAFATAVLQAAPSVNITTTRENSIIFGCTADWKAINGATRTLRDAATERFYFRDSHFTSYHYTKAAATIGAYTEGVSLPTGQQSSTALLEIRGGVSSASIPPIVTTHPSSQNVCPGSSVSFNSAATGGTPTVQWQSSTDGNIWTNVNGATNSTLTFAVTVADNNKLYRAIWTNSGGPVSSNPATLIVNSIAAPVVTVVNNCGSSELSASVFAGSLLWSNGATTPSITVTTAGTYTVTQTVNGCISNAGSGVAAPKAIPTAPTVTVTNQCGSSLLTASGFAGSLLWSTGETSSSITATTAGAYTVTQTISGCTSVPGTGVAAPLTTLGDAPVVTTVNNCGNSVLTASGFTGSLLWSTGETTTSITVTTSGTYTVTQSSNGCVSPEGSGTAAPIGLPATPVISVVNNCESSTLTATGFAGSLLWSTGETTPSITVATAGAYSVTQTADGCTSLPGNSIAAPNSIPVAPLVSVVNNCESSTLTATDFTGSLLWSTGETTPSITVATGGTYTVTQTVNGCTSNPGSGNAAPNSNPPAPSVAVVNNCGSSTLTASDYTGSLLWSTGETTPSITATTAGTYTVTQTVNGCVSPAGSGIAAPIELPSTPNISVINNCESSTLTASGFTGSLLWSTGETTPSITVTTAGTYTVSQTVDGCTSLAGNGIAAPNSIPVVPLVSVVNNCESSTLTATDFTGSLLWSTGETTPSITVTTGGTYTVTQTVNGCTSNPGSGIAAPNSNPLTPSVLVANNCGSSTLTASDFTGSLLWSTGETTPSITVTTAGTYTVTQTVNGCVSPAGSGIAAPIELPSTPAVSVINNCESSTLTASGFTGSLLWSTGETTPSITVTTAGTYTVSQTVDGCTSLAGNGIAAPNSIPVVPLVSVVNNCESSTLTATDFTGSLLWSTGETTSSITVTAAGTYTVTQTVNGCTSNPGSGNAAPNSNPSAPSVAIVNNCGSSKLTASDFTGSLLWSTGETTPSITVATAGTYTVTQTVNGCESSTTQGIAAPITLPSAPNVSVFNNCESSTLTAADFTESLLWSTGETTPSITVTTAGAYTVTQTLNGCISNPGSGIAVPKATPVAPTVAVINNCGSSTLTASGFTGNLLWSTGETASAITVNTSGTYTVTQTVNGCTSSPGGGNAEPKSIPLPPAVIVDNYCGGSSIWAFEYTGTLLWNTGETGSIIATPVAGTFYVNQTVNGCPSQYVAVVAAPLAIPPPPSISVINNCETSELTASGFVGSLLWSTGETTPSIIATTSGTYTVTQTLNGCTSNVGSGIAAPNTTPASPIISVVDNCGSSTLTASGFTGNLLWSTGETTMSITVTTAGTYTVTQAVNGCTSNAGSGIAAPKTIPAPPAVTVLNNCSYSVLTAESFTGALLWSTGETSNSITVTTPGIYTVSQTINGCVSSAGNGTAAPLNSTIAAPIVTVLNNCGTSVLSADSFTGTLLWSTGETTSSITVTTAGTYTVTQTLNGCTSAAGSVVAAPKTIPSTPSVTVVDNCGSSILTASGFTGSLLWSTGETTTSITVTSPGTYTVTQTINGCTSDAGSGVATPKIIPPAPTVSVTDNCGSSVLTASGFTGSLLWNTGATTAGITVTSAGSYTVTQTLNGCTSAAGNGVATPKTIPVLSSSLTTTAVSGVAFTYLPTSITGGTNFSWSRAAVTGISNAASSGTGTINETLVNTTTSAINVTYVFTLTANGCTNTQNVVVTVSSTPVVTTVSPINGATGISTSTIIIANFSEAINGSTATASTIQIKDAANNIVTASVNTSSNQVTLTPSTALANSTTYTVTIKGGATGVKGLAGNALAGDYSWSFTTVAVASQPVTIQSVNTKTGAAATVHSLTGVPAGALLVLTTTSDAVVSNCTVTSSPSLTWTKRVDAGATNSDNAEIWTAVYIAGGSITVTSNWGPVSQASVCYVVLNAEPTLNGAFGTATLQTAPSVTVTTTRENSIIFGCTADWRNINGATRTLRDAAIERLYFRDGHYATYHYTKAAATVGAYTEGVSAPTGQQASTALLEIRSAVVIPDNTPPLISSVSPQNGAVDILISANASAVFNEAMNASTINGSTVELRNASNTLIATSISYNSGTRTLTLTPSASLVNSTVYTVIIKGGSSGVKDVAGNALVGDYSWSFTTVAADLTPPIVTSVTPANGATGISLSTAASATFNEAMNAATITNSTIELRNQSNILIAGSVSYNAATMTITVTPSSLLANSTVYTITIKGGSSGVKDVAGNPLAVDHSSSFTTTAAVAQPPVTIQSVNTKTGTAATVHSLTAVPAGALLVLATTSDAFPEDCSVSSSPTLTWTKRSDAGATNSDNAEIWTAFYSAGGSITVTSNWGDHSQTSVCYVVLNAEPTLNGAFATGVLQTAPSVAITTTRDNSIIFGCTADWKAVNGATRTLRDAATERLYYRDGNYTTYHYTKNAATAGTYTEGVSAPTGQQASTALLEIRSAATVSTRPSNAVIVAATNNSINNNVTKHSLGQNYPNPFNGITNIPFSLSKAEKVNLTLYDINGRIVKLLVDASMDAGRHVISFNSGLLASGIYYYRIHAGSFNDVKKLIIW